MVVLQEYISARGLLRIGNSDKGFIKTRGASKPRSSDCVKGESDDHAFRGKATPARN